jgi:hypothetical protein
MNRLSIPQAEIYEASVVRIDDNFGTYRNCPLLCLRSGSFIREVIISSIIHARCSSLFANNYAENGVNDRFSKNEETTLTLRINDNAESLSPRNADVPPRVERVLVPFCFLSVAGSATKNGPIAMKTD